MNHPVYITLSDGVQIKMSKGLIVRSPSLTRFYFPETFHMIPNIMKWIGNVTLRFVIWVREYVYFDLPVYS